MKNKILLSLSTLIVSGTLLTSCQKQPSADFTTDKTEYTAGETIKLSNKSIDADKYKWTMPDGQTATSQNVDYQTSVNSPDGTLTFKLEAISKNGKKTDVASKTVTIKAAKGKVVFWQHPSGGFDITTVTINGESKQITTDFNTAPDCGQSGAANFELKIGTYNFSASDGSYTWNSTVTIQANTCVQFQLQ